MNVDKGLISIITPVYNRQEVISDCIQSVLAQSYQNFEMVIVDDGSVDNTCNICKEFAQSDSRIKVLSGEHRGVSAARNMALDAATGEYVFFLDSDDAIHPLLLETLYHGMEDSGVGIGCTNVSYVRNSQWSSIRIDTSEVSAADAIKFYCYKRTIDALMHGRTPLGTMPGIIMRADLIGDTKFDTDLHIGEDFLFNYENIIKGTDSIELANKWYFFRFHENNSSRDNSFAGFWSRFHRRELVWKSEIKLGRKKYADMQKKDAFGCYLRCVKNHSLTSPDSKKMRSVLRKYHKEMLPAFGLKQKIIYILHAYFPILAAGMAKLRSSN